MGFSLTDSEKQALRRDTSIMEAASEQHLDTILEDLQGQLDGEPIDGSVDNAAMADDAVGGAELTDALADTLLAVTWGTPDGESGNTIEVTLQLKDAKGEALAAQRVFEVHVADTQYGADSGTATIAAGTAPIGTILSGSGTAAVKVQTDAAGQMKLKVSETAAASRYLSARPCYGSPILDCQAAATLVFA